MSERTEIEWADATWSPIWTCTQISPACDNCYAKALAHRFGYGWNGEGPVRLFGEHHWNEPVRWNRRAQAEGTRPRVFPSMCDPLDKDWPTDVRERFWRLVDATPYLTWLILTKRIGNYERLGPGAVIGRHPANVWLGATVVNQEEADRDVPKLLATPARVRFLSIEPMLGPIDLRLMTSAPLWAGDGPGAPARRTSTLGLSWVIAGGESGPRARPAHPDWFRSLRDQCAAAGVPFMFKQHGEWAPGSGDFGQGAFRTAAVAIDGRIAEGGYDVRDYPRGADSHDGWAMVHRAGKKAAGRLLDGVQHDGVPTP